MLIRRWIGLFFLWLVIIPSLQAETTRTVLVSPAAKSFDIQLAANPTTGYQWSVVRFDKQLLTLSTARYQQLSSKLIGSGGHMIYTFKLNKGIAHPKQTELTFKYARPWESKGFSLQRVVVLFQ